jgi:hypothetical protein
MLVQSAICIMKKLVTLSVSFVLGQVAICGRSRRTLDR